MKRIWILTIIVFLAVLGLAYWAYSTTTALKYAGLSYTSTGITQANLRDPSQVPQMPTLVYCNDCNANLACTAGGSGAWALWTAGAWNCATTASGISITGLTNPLTADITTNGHGVDSLNAVTLFAEKYPGADWGDKIMNTVAACPAGYICNVNGEALVPGTAINDVWIQKPNIHIKLGAGRYVMAAHKFFRFQPQTFVSSPPGPTNVVPGYDLSGEGQEVTILDCTTNAHGPTERCHNIEGTLLIKTSGCSSYDCSYQINGTVPAGATSFVMANAADATTTGLRPNDWVEIGALKVGTFNSTFDFSGVVEHKRVISVVGTTVNFTPPLKAAISATSSAAVWTKLANYPWYPQIHDLTIDARNSTGVTSAALWTHGAHEYRVREYAGSGTSTGLYWIHSANLVIEDNDIVQTGTTASPYGVEFGADDSGIVRRNHFRCQDNTNSGNGIIFDYGTDYSIASNNWMECSGPGMVGFGSTDADNNIVTGNFISGTKGSNSAGISLSGSSRNIVTDNSIKNVDFGIQIVNSGGAQPIWRPATAQAAKSCILENPDNGWIFCTDLGGTTGAVQPTWPTTPGMAYGVPVGATVVDGTVTWTNGGLYARSNHNTLGNNFTYDLGNNSIIYGKGTYSTTNYGFQPDPNPAVGMKANFGVNGMLADMQNNVIATENLRQLDGPAIINGRVNLNGGMQINSIAAVSGVAASQWPPCSVCGTNYGYIIYGRTLRTSGYNGAPSAEVLLNAQDALSPAHVNKITWGANEAYACYDVYGRTPGGELLMDPNSQCDAFDTLYGGWSEPGCTGHHAGTLTCLPSNSFYDDGSVAPAGALPTLDQSSLFMTGPAGMGYRLPNVALGGGAAPTLGTIGGAGPGTAGQNSWMQLLDSTGAKIWIPVWK